MSDRTLRIAAGLVALAGIGIATYLTWVHYDATALVCTVGDCHAVQESQFAAIGPLPVSLLGLVMFAIILICELVGSLKPELRMSTEV